MKLAIVFLLAAMWAIAPAAAGDTATSRVLGFTEEGRLFAFEEFGVQDGSGFPYSNIYVVDTDTDSWVSGTPIRVTIEEDGGDLAAAREEARTRLETAVDADFDWARAETLAHAPLGEFEQDPTRLAFGMLVPSNPLDEPAARYEARLEIFHAETQVEDCTTYIGDRANGFRLIVERLDGDGSSVLSEDDGPIPASRGCPITYRLSEIVAPAEFWPSRVAVLISVFTPGFEGPDRRFLAVTGRLPE